ncbi:hypothetical protein KC338_g84 [Hortaea werneckii]|nr:hypothetical protein KC338_g84 [Hortaea werneckii]
MSHQVRCLHIDLPLTRSSHCTSDYAPPACLVLSIKLANPLLQEPYGDQILRDRPPVPRAQAGTLSLIEDRQNAIDTSAKQQ